MSAPLAATIDGEPLGGDEARAMWARFSAWMEEHKGDLAGFAAAEGLASVHPEMHGGRAVLVASRSAPQRAYQTAALKPGVDRDRSGEAQPIQSARPGRRKNRGRSH